MTQLDRDIRFLRDCGIVRDWIKPLKVATFFSGGFGSIEFALKYQEMSHDVLVACEFEKDARKSYLNNHPDPICEFEKDIRNFKGAKYKDQIDLAHFSPPCTSYSLAGNREGENCSINGDLMNETVRVIDEMRPKMFTVENVIGLISSGDTLNNIVLDLKNLGYQVSVHKLNAKDYGTPQSRNRVFIVGFYGTGATFSTPPKKKLKLCIGDLLEKDIDKKYYLSAKLLRGFKKKKGCFKGKFNPKTKDEIIGTLTARYQSVGITDPYIFDPKLDQIGNIDTKGHNSLWGRVYNSNGIAPTQNANGGGMGAKTGLFSVENGIRRLTPREGARAMGDFDDLFKFGDFKDNKLYHFIGNAIDINTYRVLLVAMLKHQKNINFDKKFVAQKKVEQLALF